MNKEEAIVFLLKVFRNPMSMTSKSTSEQAFKLAEEHNINATELLTKYKEYVWKV